MGVIIIVWALPEFPMGTTERSSLPTQFDIERVVRPLFLKYYFLGPIAWLALSVWLIFNGHLELAAALFGAGPFLLFALYQGVVNKPYIELTSDSPYFDIRLKHREHEGDVYYYPYIEFCSSVTNVGHASAQDCYARIDLNDGEAGYFTRWTSELYESNLDLHPEWTREIVIFQLVPTEESLEDVLSKQGHSKPDSLRIHPFGSMAFGVPEADGDTISVGDFEMHVHRPMHPRREDFELDVREDFSPREQRRFLAKPLALDGEPTVKAEFAAEDWAGSVDIGKIDLNKALERGNWFDPPEDTTEVHDTLKKLGWIGEQ